PAMLSTSCSGLVILLILRGTNGDSVNQTEVPVVLPEEAPMTLNCAYETLDSAPYLFWYVQYPNRAPQLLLKGSTANPRAEEQGFQATLVKSDKTFHLQKRSVQTSDSAVYYCALSDTVRGALCGHRMVVYSHDPGDVQEFSSLLLLSSTRRYTACCWPWKRSKFKIKSMVSTECI
uniref:Ig-like domain-containing protein n=1 Tax=Sus scrofa TaxID=9823 RepID=A0A287BA55_PIG